MFVPHIFFYRCLGKAVLRYCGLSWVTSFIFLEEPTSHCKSWSKPQQINQSKQQSTLVISNSKGLSEILRDIRTSTYQICRIEEKLIRLTTFNKYMCNWTLEVRDILKVLWKRGEFSRICFHVVRFSCLGRDQIFTSR